MAGAMNIFHTLRKKGRLQQPRRARSRAWIATRFFSIAGKFLIARKIFKAPHAASTVRRRS
jgi:hypothetical protein